jgi:hypothetical protein
MAVFFFPWLVPWKFILFVYPLTCGGVTSRLSLVGITRVVWCIASCVGAEVTRSLRGVRQHGRTWADAFWPLEFWLGVLFVLRVRKGVLAIRNWGDVRPTVCVSCSVCVCVCTWLVAVSRYRRFVKRRMLTPSWFLCLCEVCRAWLFARVECICVITHGVELQMGWVCITECSCRQLAHSMGYAVRDLWYWQDMATTKC